MIRKNMKLLIGLIIGIIIISGFGVYAANSLSASSISIDKSNMSKVENSNLQSALDYLYGQSEKTNMITIESNVLHDTQTYLGIAYLDPTNLERKCSEADAKANRNQDGTITGVKSGCMKWYIYKEDNNNYYAILDHNTTANVKWNSNNVNTSKNEVDNALQNDVVDWNSNLNPRLITANEIAETVGANWNSETATSQDSFFFDTKNQTRNSNVQGISKYAYLYDNLGWDDPIGSCTNYGCNFWDGVNCMAYWTDTPASDSNSAVWLIFRRGELLIFDAAHVNPGLRPVITIPKSLF